MLNAKKLKKEFPIFNRKINGKNLVYLDNASTTQKPKVVIEAIKHYYENTNANIHRGIHTLSEEATAAYENCREAVVKFINAKSAREIIFTRNTTEAINLVAYTWGEANIHEGDEIISTAIEHHSNLVPWQELCRRKKAKLKIIPLAKDYTLDLKAYKNLLTKKTKLVVISAMSNVLGTIPPVKNIIKEAHKFGAITLVDAAQSAGHMITDVTDLDCDFLTFSSHKVLGPTGVGILYGKEELLEKMPPFLFGGDMVKTVSESSASWNDLPWKFEAGTPNIADVIAFEKALEFITKIGFKNIQEHDAQLLEYAAKRFSKYPQVKLFLSQDLSNNGGIISFTIEGIHPHDIATIFNEEGVAIRSGHHCNQPLMERLQVPATARMSFYIYSTTEDIDRAENALKRTLKIFKL